MERKKLVKRILLIVTAIVCILIVGIILIYSNLNRLLTNALNNGFNANRISDVYELKFEGLNVNIITGSVGVMNVEMYPREKPLKDYPYINSSFRLSAQKMILQNVALLKLIRTNKLDLNKIELVEPGIDFSIADSVPVFFPFIEKAQVADSVPKEGKRSIEYYALKEFKMVDAYFHVVNTAKERKFDIKGINLTLRDMIIDQQPGLDKISYEHFDFSIGELTGSLQDKALRYINFKDFKVNIDSLSVEQTQDTVIYHFADANTSIQNLDIQTEDSIYHIALESFNLSYSKKAIEFKNLSFKPNISDAELQKKTDVRKENFAATIGSIEIKDLNFDSLIYDRKLYIGEILLDDVSATIFKDLRKPFPPNHRPKYLGQQIQGITMPMLIQKVKATKVNLVNTEITPDGNTGKANINRATMEMTNITSLPSTDMLTVKGDAYVENAAHAFIQMNFNYNKPEFSIEGRVEKFDITKLNSLTNSYAPARITKGMVDGITFSGMVFETRSTGTMKFLYHDLVVDLELEDKAKWKSALLGFAANTYLNASNPVSPNLPERVVKFEVERDMRKGFLSMLIKSVLDGVKETFIMSKENKKAYQEDKKQAKSKAKEKKG